MRDLPEPEVRLGWGRRSSALDPGVRPEALQATLRHRATVALVVNLVVALCLFGLPSIAGAVTAELARRAVPADPDRAERLIRWSWAFLATNLLFYVLLLAVGFIVAGYLLLASRSRA